MTLTRITLTLVLVLAGASLAFAGGGKHHPKRSSHEVWTVDQSNSAGKSTGGTLYVYDPQRLGGKGRSRGFRAPHVPGRPPADSEDRHGDDVRFAG